MIFRALSHHIWKDTQLYARVNQAKNSIQYDIPMDYTGKGIGIAILDTGISAVDDFLLPQRRILAFRDFVNGKADPYDDNGHGTHVKCMKAKHSLY